MLHLAVATLANADDLATSNPRHVAEAAVDIDAIDDEYRSTPLGVAARRGQSTMVELLLERGADPVAAGASWAVPLAWAERKGHSHVADMLRQAGAEHDAPRAE